MAATAGDERDWEEALAEIVAGLAASTAHCRHCTKRIHLVGGRWEDELGIAGCVKGELKTPDYPGQPGGAIAREVILHEPRPVIA